MVNPRLAAPAIALTLAACGGSGGGSSTTTGTGGGAPGSSSTTATAQGGSGGGGNLFDAGTAGAAGGVPDAKLIYASTDTQLFTLDPKDPALALTEVGTFDCIDPVNGPHKAMVDIAVDKSDALWGVTGHNVYPLTIQGTTIHCGTSINLGATSPTFYGLTFAPEGVLDPTAEVLVGGNSAGELWRIDTATGTPTLVGNFGAVPADDGNGHIYANAGQPWELSGDIVFLANAGSPVGFATVRDCPTPPSTTNCNKVDTLIEIDMTALSMPGNPNVTKAVRGQILRSSACTTDNSNGYGSMYGIAAWDDQVYGFSRTGNLVPISNVDGTACLRGNYAPNQFSGAAVTTLAPVKPPPPVK